MRKWNHIRGNTKPDSKSSIRKRTNPIIQPTDPTLSIKHIKKKINKYWKKEKENIYQLVGLVALLEMIIPCLHSVDTDHLPLFCHFLYASLEVTEKQLIDAPKKCRCFTDHLILYNWTTSNQPSYQTFNHQFATTGLHLQCIQYSTKWQLYSH